MSQNKQEENQATLNTERGEWAKRVSNSVKSFVFAFVCVVWWGSGLTDKTDILFSLLVVVWIKLQYMEGK